MLCAASARMMARCWLCCTQWQWLHWLHATDMSPKQTEFLLFRISSFTVWCVGKVIGRFYDSTGSATGTLLAAQASVDKALAAKQRDDDQQRIFPPCNSRWNEADGSTVWCSTKRWYFHLGWKWKKEVSMQNFVPSPSSSCLPSNFLPLPPFLFGPFPVPGSPPQI